MNKNIYKVVGVLLGLLLLNGCQMTTEVSKYQLSDLTNKQVKFDKNKWSKSSIHNELFDEIRDNSGWIKCPCTKVTRMGNSTPELRKWGKSLELIHNGNDNSTLIITYYNGGESMDKSRNNYSATELSVLVNYKIEESDKDFILTIDAPNTATLKPMRSAIFVPYEPLYNEIDLEAKMEEMFGNILKNI